eukprot:TRINITY_DN14548_c0_g1_i5.p6 TRINITY_DN14548_c0_g1~~TRINITY_DN14548_c0_g1_i5.p6  ORF type:complete len:132 (+),score=1.12 TRINITY_DN14548_c0_g1_i5:1436-1831(+)
MLLLRGKKNVSSVDCVMPQLLPSHTELYRQLPCNHGTLYRIATYIANWRFLLRPLILVQKVFLERQCFIEMFTTHKKVFYCSIFAIFTLVLFSVLDLVLGFRMRPALTYFIHQEGLFCFQYCRFEIIVCVW